MKRIRAVIVGAGHRALKYASYATEHPDELQIVAVVDPDEFRRQAASREFGIKPRGQFASVADLVRQLPEADVAINGTMDLLHVQTTIPLLEHGYHVLLEKPIAVSEDELWRLRDAARRHGRNVGICHVLRHTPFYSAIRHRVADGAIGDLIGIEMTEHVSYHHMAVAFVRGKWNRRDRGGSGMLMSKSSHDLDLIAWFKAPVRPLQVSSHGMNFQFRPARAPEGAGTRCLVDCPIEADCLYSARAHYLEHPDRWSFYVWAGMEDAENSTAADKEAFLRTSPYGTCVWKTDMDVVDHQTVAIEFEDGTTGSLNMMGGAARASRSIHLIGTTGEIDGRFEEGTYAWRRIDPHGPRDYKELIVDTRPDRDTDGDTTGERGGHGGGDLRLVRDFLRVVRGESPTLSTTTLEQSLNGHLIGFAAERSRQEQSVVTVRYR